jgi:hypothetical protein
MKVRTAEMSKLPEGMRRIAALRKSIFVIVLISSVGILLFLSSSDTETAHEDDVISIIQHGTIGTRADDCASCHFTITQAVDGGKHSWAACETCHDPDSKSEINITTECNYCHGDRHDFEYPTCLDCHDPHATNWKHEITNEQCANCHTNETARLDMGSHSWQDCTNCHQNHTAPANQCDSCHGVKHSDWPGGGYEYPECLDCHDPIEATFKHNLSEGNCSECHGDHQVVTKTCDECHGEYHGYSYPKCLECHEPMHAASATPEEEVIFDVLLFSIIALVASIAIFIGLALSRRKSEA